MQQGSLKTGSNSIHINLLPAGMYMVEVTSSPSERPGEAGTKTIRK